MKAPHSYTREDIVEINSHSGYLLLSKVLQLIIEQGARQARPGEFTLRAFLNGRIDLTQAEAVIDLTPEEVRTAEGWPPVSADDVLDMHLLLKEHDGDFESILTL